MQSRDWLRILRLEHNLRILRMRNAISRLCNSQIAWNTNTVIVGTPAHFSNVHHHLHNNGSIGIQLCGGLEWHQCALHNWCLVTLGMLSCMLKVVCDYLLLLIRKQREVIAMNYIGAGLPWY